MFNEMQSYLPFGDNNLILLIMNCTANLNIIEENKFYRIAGTTTDKIAHDTHYTCDDVISNLPPEMSQRACNRLRLFTKRLVSI